MSWHSTSLPSYSPKNRNPGSCLLVPGCHTTRVVRLDRNQTCSCQLPNAPVMSPCTTAKSSQRCSYRRWCVEAAPERREIRVPSDGERKTGMIIGEAKDDNEQFEFTIEPFVTTGFLLSIRYSGDCHHTSPGRGVANHRKSQGHRPRCRD
jgi:hypothetical protein